MITQPLVTTKEFVLLGFATVLLVAAVKNQHDLTRQQKPSAIADNAPMLTSAPVELLDHNKFPANPQRVTNFALIPTVAATPADDTATVALLAPQAHDAGTTKSLVNQ